MKLLFGMLSYSFANKVWKSFLREKLFKLNKQFLQVREKLKLQKNALMVLTL